MKARVRNQAGKALTAEFAVALTVFLLITMFPLINLIGFAMGAGTQYLMTVQCAGGAGASTTFNDALSAMDREAVLFANSGFGQFAKLHPVGGHNGTGTDLYLIETSLAGSNSLAYGPNTGGPAALNSNNNVYEYQVRSTFDVGPFVNMASMPWVGDIPGVGRPARLSFVAHRNCEFTEGLAMGATGVPIVAAGGSGSSGGSSGTGVNTAGVASAASSGTGPYTVASSGGTSTDPNIVARNRGSSAGNSSGGGGLADWRRRRNNNNNSSGNASVTSTTTTTSSTSTYSSNQALSFGASQSDGANSTSIDSNSSASNSTDGGQTASTSITTNAAGNGTAIVQTNNSANPDGSNSTSYTYSATTGPTNNGGIVSSQSQSGSGNQNSSSSQSSNQSP